MGKIKKPSMCASTVEYCDECEREQCSRGMKEMAIKPCPFCGKAPKVIEDAIGDGLRPMYSVACRNYEHCNMVVFTTRYYTKKEAVDSWNNRRAEPSESRGGKRGSKVDH